MRRGRVALAVGVLAALVPLTATGQAAQATREYAGTVTGEFDQAEVRGTLELDDGGILSFVAPTTLPPSTTAGDPASGGGVAGLEELLVGVPVTPDTIVVIAELACGDVGVDEAANQCAVSDDLTSEFIAEIQDHVNDPEVLRTLRGAVALGQFRAPDGLPIVPSLGHVFPVILQLAAQADAGDADALLALRRLIGGLINVATASRT